MPHDQALPPGVVRVTSRHPCKGPWTPVVSGVSGKHQEKGDTMNAHDTKTPEGFLDTYADGDEQVVLDVTVDPDRSSRPFIVVRYGDRVLILNLMALPDHLCVDVRGFVGDEKARVGAFGMESGRRVEFPEEDTPGTSHGWPAMSLVTLLLGEQKDRA